MKFWDSSAVLPLVLEEPRSAALRKLLRGDTEAAIWWATPVECVSAIARLEREGALQGRDVTDALELMDAFVAAAAQVEPVEELRETARRLLRVHPLRAADALQLAAAFMVSERRPATLTLVTCDDRLLDAAAKEGFRLAPEPSA
jgi:predicted nucleic acid-binding protein